MTRKTVKKAAKSLLTSPPAALAQPPTPTASQSVEVVFTLNAPHAQKVFLCGEFNHWSPEAAPLKRQDGGRWRTALVLPPGHYQYKFVVDGQWRHDPNARENVPNPHGSLNSVIAVVA